MLRGALSPLHAVPATVHAANLHPAIRASDATITPPPDSAWSSWFTHRIRDANPRVYMCANGERSVTMERIFSSVSLRDPQREVKEAAREDVVRITEDGNGAFVFCSEEVFERRLQRAAEEARYAKRVAQAICDGRADHGGLFGRREQGSLSRSQTASTSSGRLMVAVVGRCVASPRPGGRAPMSSDGGQLASHLVFARIPKHRRQHLSTATKIISRACAYTARPTNGQRERKGPCRQT